VIKDKNARRMKISPSRSQLDTTVIEIELTLISIIQGVALTFLIESARLVLSPSQRLYWPYVAAGLFVIFVFWSRSVLHIITVIRWPLEFGHNFFYIGCAFSEALLFTRLRHPEGWFALGTVFGVVGWALFVYDLRLVRARSAEHPGRSGQRLIELVRRDQFLNIYFLLPGVILYNLFAFLCIRRRPDLFLRNGRHLWLGLGEMVGFAAYLCYVLAYFKTIIPVLSAAREEQENGAELVGPAKAERSS
jgi:hypothetical protein